MLIQFMKWMTTDFKDLVVFNDITSKQRKWGLPSHHYARRRHPKNEVEDDKKDQEFLKMWSIVTLLIWKLQLFLVLLLEVSQKTKEKVRQLNLNLKLLTLCI